MSQSRGARPGFHPIKKLCDKCKKNPAVSGKKLCQNCIATSPAVRNSANPRHPRQVG
jgi:hypothetical protein